MSYRVETLLFVIFVGRCWGRNILIIDFFLWSSVTPQVKLILTETFLDVNMDGLY
jgi:hypothetical protein